VVDRESPRDHLGRIVGAVLVPGPSPHPQGRRLVVEVEEEDGVERPSDLDEHLVELLGLDDVAREAVEHEAAGGVVLNSGAFDFSDCAFLDNHADGRTGTVNNDAAAIYSDAYQKTISLTRCVFEGNTAAAGACLDIDGGRLIINPTNGSSYTGTVLQGQQVASSRLRAVENGRWVVQASPTGFSAFITPGGAVRQRTGVSEQKVIIDTITLADGRTWYSRTGDLPWLSAVVLALAAVLVAGRRLTRPAE